MKDYVGLAVRNNSTTIPKAVSTSNLLRNEAQCLHKLAPHPTRS
jgi:hypothetical protein